MTAFLINLFIKNKNDVADTQVRSKYGRLGGFVGIACNILLSLIKFIAGTLAGSVSMVADSLNNLSDIGSSVVTLLGFKLAAKPADREHPFGHGRMEYMSALFVSFLIILVGLELVKTSFEKILHPQALNISLLTFVVLVISIGIKLWMSLFNRKLGAIIDSSALKATAQDSINDVFATSAVLISVGVAKIFNINIDPYVGLAVGAFVVYSGINTAKGALDPLLGMLPEGHIVEGIENYVLSYKDFVGIHDLIVHNYGPGRSFASLHVEVPMDIDIVHCHELIDTCEREIFEKFKIETVIHMDPIATNDQYVNCIRQQLMVKLHEFDSALHIHDFRVVQGEQRTNLIFDVVIPQRYRLSDDKLKDEISKIAAEIDDTFFCVITVDMDYNTH